MGPAAGPSPPVASLAFEPPAPASARLAASGPLDNSESARLRHQWWCVWCGDKDHDFTGQTREYRKTPKLKVVEKDKTRPTAHWTKFNIWGVGGTQRR